jgi:2-oxoglutarate dehydrogenase E1 component
MDKFSYIANADPVAIDQLYQSYLQNPESVDGSWKEFFEGFDFSLAKYGENNGYTKQAATPVSGDVLEKEIQVRSYIYEFRRRAHLVSDTNPVRQRKDRKPRLELKDFGLSDADLDTKFFAGKIVGIEGATLRQIIDKLKKIYTGTIGFEFMYLRDPERLQWFQSKIENEYPNFNPGIDNKKRILKKLNEAVIFENFLHTKYVGQKRFSLEGGENTIPGLDRIIQKSADLGVEEVVIGMAHRGRLNILCNILGKTYEQIFNEFEGGSTPDLTMGDGDVKYHMGYSSQKKTLSGKLITLKLAPNPSHLEAVDPVVLGYTRGQIDDEYKGDQTKALPILIHGDAAVAGQGIIYEIAQMAKLEGYNVGGTIHYVINNQVGFTTDFEDARSSIYCTDVAKIIDAPVLHVNGDDAEGVFFAATLAAEYRQKFGRDIFIDMVCYRRHGHNESDEPKFTQPKLYNLIAKHPNPREIYVKKLAERGDLDGKLAQDMDQKFRDVLQDRLNMVKQKPLPYAPQKQEEEWMSMQRSTPKDFDISPVTAISKKTIDVIGDALCNVPSTFKPIKQIENLLKDRKKMFKETNTVNWSTAELLAFGSLLSEGKIVRMSGQDVKRGTFSSRHAVLFDVETNEQYNSLNAVTKDQNKLRIFNSLLSEYGVLGFEYGYAMASPQALTLWEAQFGDFVNGTQVIIDQFIASAESKWQRMNGLVILLPHGYEGQGPEHSSARLERFLQLCAEYNMIVANITLPANYFHFLRRQLAWGFRKPAVVMSPKSLLRHPMCISSLDDFTKGGFHEIIDDWSVKPKDVKKVLVCSGKIYFDLYNEQQAKKRTDVAIVRMEQLFPLPEKQLDALVEKYKGASFVWVQEEPENMGSWGYILRMYRKIQWELVSRKASASPATGYNKVHVKEQEEIVKKSFA